jgi:type VI secretion system protein ImpL
VIFGDAAAVRLTAAGARVGFWRRVGLGVVAGVALLYAIALTVSYRGNRAMQASALEATRGIASLAPNPVDLPPADALQRLDALRTQLDSLSAYEHEGAPLGLGWGLYSGTKFYPEVRGAYFAAFNKLMFAGTHNNMLGTLRALPDTPRASDDYGETYALLKAYIVTTSHPEKSTAEFLAPALMTRWLAGRQVDSARAQLARRQFTTYANELRYSNPFPDSADVAAVAKARKFLRQFAGSESIYQFMLAEAAKTNPAIQFNKKVAGAAPYVVDSYEVPGAFTKGGSVFMLGAFKTVDKFITGESWVVGEDAGGVDKAKLVADLSARYAADYAGHWRKFLSSASVARYSNVKDAAQKLSILSGNQSPLLALFSIVSQNTAVPLADVATTFQPVQLVTPPTSTDKLIGDKNAPYINALLAFQSSLDQTANAAGPAAEAAAGQAAGNATAARTAARQIASGFTIDQQGHVHSIVQNLMEAPIAYAEPLLKSFGAAEINVRARAFCSVARPLLAKFPFSPDASAQASLAEVTAMLRPGTGSLWKFYDDALAAVLPKQGNQFAPNASAGVKLAPGFVTFMNRAATFADIMFKDDAQQPHLSFTVGPLPGDPFSTVTITLNGETIRASANGNLESARIDWTGTAREAKLAASNGGPEFLIAGPFNGTWAAFQLFYAADDWQASPNGYRVGWGLSTANQRVAAANGRGAKVTVQLDGAPAGVVLRKTFFAGSECSGDIAR